MGTIKEEIGEIIEFAMNKFKEVEREVKINVDLSQYSI
jgi:hypothetical protein